MNAKWMKAAFAASAIYDGVVAIVFLFLGTAIYD